MGCLNCLEIDGHTFGLYSIVGFKNTKVSPIDGCWAGVIYIRSKIDYSSHFPNNIETQESNEVEYLSETAIDKALDDTVLVADDLKDIIFKAYMDKELLLLEIINISIRIPDEGATKIYKAIQALLPYSAPIISKKILRTKLST